MQRRRSQNSRRSSAGRSPLSTITGRSNRSHKTSRRSKFQTASKTKSKSRRVSFQIDSDDEEYQQCHDYASSDDSSCDEVDQQLKAFDSELRYDRQKLSREDVSDDSEDEDFSMVAELSAPQSTPRIRKINSRLDITGAAARKAALNNDIQQLEALLNADPQLVRDTSELGENGTFDYASHTHLLRAANFLFSILLLFSLCVQVPLNRVLLCCTSQPSSAMTAALN